VKQREIHHRAYAIFIGVVFVFVWINSFVGTPYLENWLIENTLTVIALLFLLGSYAKHPFSTTSYMYICVFLCLHVYGSKYSYAENHFGYWLQDAFHTLRNPYDRLVHFSFGLLLYYPLREWLISWVKLTRLLTLIPILIILSASALYEIFEWGVADVFFVDQGLSYLGAQGDIWDTQKDMGLAFLGVLLAAAFGYLYRRYAPTSPSILRRS